MNQEFITKLSNFWEQYKSYFKLPAAQHQEKYKWPVLKQVYGKWDWSREDKASMFKDAFTIKGYNNLWSSGNFYPVDHTNWMFNQFLLETTEAFNSLFDETKELELRIEEFIKYYDEKLPILQGLLPDKKINNHYHSDRRAIALYLSLQYPDKYFLYKFGMIQGFAQKTGLPRFIKGRKENLFRFYSISNEVLEFIKTDLEFLNEYRSFCNAPENYSDNSLHLLIQDFIYSIANHFTLIDSSTFSNVWLYSPGEQAYLWDDFYKEKVMALGWDFLGDLESYESKNDLNLAFIDHHKKDGDYKNNVLANFQFSAEMEINDLVIVLKGKSNFLGFGTVQSAYYYDDQSDEYHSRRKVNWIKKGNWTNSIFEPPIKTLTKLTTKETINQILDLLQISDSNPNKTKDLEFMPLNQILYGPPGTGKTFNTINEAISIINPTFDLTQERSKIKEEYNRLMKDGHIVFTTFHQSMSYEDFIEGIKPLKPGQDEAFLKYDIEDGLFKIACANAGYFCYQKSESLKRADSNYNFDDLYDAFLEHHQDLLNKNQPIVFKTLTGKDVTILNINSNDSIRARALNSVAQRNPAPLTKENIQKLYDRFSSIDEINSLKQVQETVEVTPRTTEFYAVFKALKEFETSIFKSDEIEQSFTIESIDETEKLKKFNAGVFKNAIKECANEADTVVLIIDEINRGNVSAIFGELITLIEDDKRMGRDESLEIMLPYSKQKFSVPANLHILGTMNTADRSVEALDTALRRRFSFIEKLPDSSKLEETEDGINLKFLLESINDRIEVLVDRDHTIGHAFIINVKNLDHLRKAMANKIFPLLQEYFYGNYEKMTLVIGTAFFDIKEMKNIKFAVHSDNYDLVEKVYHLKNILDKEKMSDDEFRLAIETIIAGV